MFEKKTIDVKCKKDGDIYIVSVPAVVNKLVPGLAVTMSEFGLFEVTHIATGRKLSNQSERFYGAAAELARWGLVGLHCLADWCTEDPVKIIADHYDNPVPFDGCTSTSHGVTRPLTIKEWIAHQLSFGQLMPEFPWEDDPPQHQCERLFETIAELRAE